VFTFPVSFEGLVNASLRLPAGRQGNRPHCSADGSLGGVLISFSFFNNISLAFSKVTN
jgi:hypothetical protein